MTPKSTPPFSGIPPIAARLVAELAHRQDKAWYAEHKEQLDAQVYAPLRALFAEAAPRLSRSFPRQPLTTKVFRIHRDVRFSKDKSPFKDHASGVILVGADARPGSAAAALYVAVGPESEAAAGQWSMEPEQLARFRRAVLHERHGAQLEKLLRPLVAGGFEVISAGQLSRAPKGVDPRHPRAELLRRKGLALDFPPAPRGMRQSAAFLDWCVEQARAAAPVVRWLLAHCA